jgi:hypothetical protein
MSPSPRRLTDIRKKQNSLENSNNATHITTMQIPPLSSIVDNSNSNSGNIETSVNSCVMNDGKMDASNSNGSSESANKYDENVSDNGSEISDEGYRSLGLIQSNNPKRISLHSQASNEDADTNGKIMFVACNQIKV